MTDDLFLEQLSEMREMIYRVSSAQLERACDRDDAVQEAMFKAWHNRHKLRDERYMKTWVIRILINECHNIHRRRHREVITDSLPESPVISENNLGLYEALHKLDRKLRIPVILHYIEGYSTQEISKILKLPKGTVLWRMSKARKELAQLLDTETGEQRDDI